jgi:hypothetical protein
VTAVLLALVTTASTGQEFGSASAPVLVVRACAETGVDDATLMRATAEAERLLSAAGVTTKWRVCQRQGPGETTSGVAPDAVVILSARRLAKDSAECGVASRGSPAVGTALVSVPCVAEFTGRLARHPAYRAHPFLASGRHDDFLGVLVAHEIGHLLGLRHARAGVMRARLDADDIVAFRSKKLWFSAEERARLCQFLVRRAMTDSGRPDSSEREERCEDSTSSHRTIRRRG